MRSLLSIWYELKNGIGNVIKWLPVIWKDRDWDEYYLLVIMHKKLSNMEKAFRSEDAMALSSNEVADEIKEVKVALKRLIDDEYYEESCRSHGQSPYENGYSKDIYDLEETLRNQDIQKVFSEDVSKKIRGWWD